MRNTLHRKHVKDSERWSWIQPSMDYCWLCSRHGIPLERHEIYNGFNRETSKSEGCVVALCHHCHEEIHRNQELDLKVKRLVEKMWMKHYGKTEEDFRQIFHKSYLGEEDA